MLCGGDQVIIENSPVGESLSNGAAENAIQQIQGFYRTHKCSMEGKYNQKIEDHPVLTWLPRYASSTRMYYKKGNDGRTGYYRLKGREFNKRVPDFAECIWYLKPKSKGRNKAEYRWSEGVWVGVREESGEHIVLTEQGAIKCRAIRRRAVEDAWNWEEFTKVKGTPWEPVPGQPNSDLRIRVSDGMRDQPIVHQGVGPGRDFVRRAFRIEKDDVRNHGPTPSCGGCRAAIAGGVARNHTAACRTRFEDIFITRNDPRIDRHVERFLGDEGEEGAADEHEIENDEPAREQGAQG